MKCIASLDIDFTKLFQLLSVKLMACSPKYAAVIWFMICIGVKMGTVQFILALNLKLAAKILLKPS